MVVSPPARLPRNHQLVLDVVRAQGAGVHSTTAAIFAASRRRQPTLGYTTVYRALLRLRDMGLISELNLPGASSVVYEPAAPAHAHFHCRHCGRIEDLPFEPPADLLDAVAGRNHLAGEVSITVQGLCGACRQTQTVNTSPRD